MIRPLSKPYKKMKSISISFLLYTLLLTTNGFAQQKTVTLDYFYNNEYKSNKEGKSERFHYIWEDKTLNGYSIWGSIFQEKGLRLNSLTTAPTTQNLKGTDIYIITDPDNDKESPSPNYMDATAAQRIADWVKKGGVLVLMTNDSANADLHHTNLLAEKFGIHFTDKVRNSVLKDLSVGTLMVPDHHPIFTTARQLYMKGISTLTLTSPAEMVLEDKGDILMAKAKYGKGTVIALGDPWIYNEYIVNDRLTPKFQNGLAAKEFTDWLIRQIPAKK